MSTHELVNTNSFWGLEIAETYGALDPSLRASGQNYGVQQNRLDVLTNEDDIEFVVAVSLGDRPAESDFSGQAEFESGNLVIDNVEGGLVPTEVSLEESGLYEVSVSRTTTEQKPLSFSVVFTKV